MCDVLLPSLWHYLLSNHECVPCREADTTHAPPPTPTQHTHAHHTHTTTTSSSSSIHTQAGRQTDRFAWAVVGWGWVRERVSRSIDRFVHTIDAIHAFRLCVHVCVHLHA
uniref:Uncharacterized protein n=1 Tax=Vitrella brassicaformis TaxID=1169539 RepID=A0A7S1KD21_9ALVE